MRDAAASCALIADSYNDSLRPFVPLVNNPHLLTILGNYWPRHLDLNRYPVRERLYQTEPGVQVLVHSQAPTCAAVAQLVIVHGLEGSSAAGYACSLAADALAAGYAVHRFNMRSCGGTESICGKSLYHSGQTGDLLFVLRELRAGSAVPIFLAGFSLGGNVVLKLAGELAAAKPPIDGVCAVSTPIDLAACVRRLRLRSNYLYAHRFLKRLKERIRLKDRLTPGLFDIARLPTVHTIYDFDDVFTAPSFGFTGADHYYQTQSAQNFLNAIRVPTLVVQAQDDPLIPFEIYSNPAFSTNPHLSLIAPEHGGHLGFISRTEPRLWLDGLLLKWLEATRNKLQSVTVH